MNEHTYLILKTLKYTAEKHHKTPGYILDLLLEKFSEYDKPGYVDFSQLEESIPRGLDDLPRELVAKIVDYNPSGYGAIAALNKEYRGLTTLSETQYIKLALQKHGKNLNDFERGVGLFQFLCEVGETRAAKACKRVYNLTIDDVRTNYNQALRKASENGHLNVVKYLLEEVGLTIDDVREDDNEALGFASGGGHLEIVKYFVEVGLTIDDVRAENNYALREASKNGHLETVKYFVEEVGLTIDDVRSNYNQALRYGDLDIVKYLVEEVGLTIDDVRSNNNWALREASENGRLDVVKYFVEEVGLTIDDVRADNNFALREASKNGHFEIVNYLNKIIR